MPAVCRYRRIRDLREDSDLTQRTYAYYESGEWMIPPQVLCTLADFSKVSVDYLPEHTDQR